MLCGDQPLLGSETLYIVAVAGEGLLVLVSPAVVLDISPCDKRQRLFVARMTA